MPRPTAPALDHVAVAVERHTDAWPRYRGDLGGEWVAGGIGPGFAPAQLRYGNGMKVEVLEPYAADRFDFLRRFLDRRGPGVHHLTFKVPFFDDALARAGAAGFAPVGVDRSQSNWAEAFLHPKQSIGIVIQIAESDGEWSSPPPAQLPATRPGRPADLVRVVHAVRSLADGVRLYEDALAGTRVDQGDGWVELAWPGPGRVRIVEWPEVVGAEPGCVHHLVFAVDRPASIAGALPSADGSDEVPPAGNFGVRLVFEPPSTVPP
jgi:methylmalonyl-CoA/ethylmalonyl-CoA epimerase